MCSGCAGARAVGSAALAALRMSGRHLARECGAERRGCRPHRAFSAAWHKPGGSRRRPRARLTVASTEEASLAWRAAQACRRRATAWHLRPQAAHPLRLAAAERGGYTGRTLPRPCCPRAPPVTMPPADSSRRAGAARLRRRSDSAMARPGTAPTVPEQMTAHLIAPERAAARLSFSAR